MLRVTRDGFGVEVLGPMPGHAVFPPVGEGEGFPAGYPRPEGLDAAVPAMGYWVRYTEGEPDGVASGVWYYFPTLREVEEGYELA